MIDFVLTEEIQKIQSDGADYHIPNEIDLVRNSDQDLARYLNGKL